MESFFVVATTCALRSSTWWSESRCMGLPAWLRDAHRPERRADSATGP